MIFAQLFHEVLSSSEPTVGIDMRATQFHVEVFVVHCETIDPISCRHQEIDACAFVSRRRSSKNAADFSDGVGRGYFRRMHLRGHDLPVAWIWFFCEHLSFLIDHERTESTW